MSGMEPILIGAALGAGTSAAMGGNPLQGAIMGGVTGGIGSGIGGVGATAQAGANTAAQAGMDGLSSTVGASLVESGASGLYGDVLEQAALSNLEYSANPFMAGLEHLMREPGTTMSALTGGMDASKMGQLSQMGGNLMGGQQKPQPAMAAPSMKQGQAPQMVAPVMSLLDERKRPQRRRLSLLSR